MRYTKLVLAVPILLGLSAAQSHAAGLKINATFDSSITSLTDAAQIEQTINSTIGVYEKDFSNPVTVTIDFKADQTISLGQSSTFVNTVSYSDYRTNLFATKAKGSDSTAFENFISPTNPVNGGTKVGTTLAELRSLGFAGYAVGAGQFDSVISLKTSDMNFSNSTAAGTFDPNKYYLSSVASHEIDEVLGLGSSLDGKHNGDAAPTKIGTMDLFRFSAPGIRSYTTDKTATSYFSVDNGTTNIVGFNQNQNGDFHDWASSGTSRVQDAFGTPGVLTTLGTAELTGLRDIGYNNSSPVPEASTTVSLGLLLALGLGNLVVARRRKAQSAQ